MHIKKAVFSIAIVTVLVGIGVQINYESDAVVVTPKKEPGMSGPFKITPEQVAEHNAAHPPTLTFETANNKYPFC